MEATPRRPSRSAVAEIAILGSLVGLETVCAMRAFPQMDDAYLSLLVRERGASSIAAAHRDRPLVGALWQRLAEASGASFWSVGFALHFVLWLGFGVLACRIWRRLFPEWERYAILVGALTVAPIVVRTQFSTVTISLLCVLSVVAAWSSVLLAWSFIRTGRILFLLCALALVAAAAVYSEYGVAAAVAGAALVAVLPWSDRAPRRRAIGAAGGLLLTAIVGYAVYLRMGDFTARPLVEPGRQMDRVSVLIRTPWNVATRFWDAVAGDLGRTAASMQLDWQSKSSLAAGAVGLMVGAAMMIASRGSASSPSVSSVRRRLMATGAALVAGLVPVALMRPVFHSAFASRFELPVLPMAGSFSVAIGLVVIDARFHRFFAAGIGVLVGLAVAREAGDALRQRGAMAAIAAVLEPVARTQGGVGLFVLSDPGLCYTAQVCTGSVTRDWAPALGRTVWVETSDEARTTLGRRTACGGLVLAGLSERQFERERPVATALWVDVGEHPPRVEPYCLSVGDWSIKGTEERR